MAATPAVSFVGLIIITLIGGLDDAITKIQLMGHWWLILVAGYFLSLIYFLYEPTFRRNQERKKTVSGLILYWEEQLAKQNKLQPSDEEIKMVREMLLERVKIWAWLDSELWMKYFPDEKYSQYLFGIVDNFMVYWEAMKIKCHIKS